VAAFDLAQRIADGVEAESAILEPTDQPQALEVRRAVERRPAAAARRRQRALGLVVAHRARG